MTGAERLLLVTVAVATVMVDLALIVLLLKALWS